MSPVPTAFKELPVDVSVIIVNWNSKDYLKQCLTSLYLHARDFTFEVIVIDGASYDGCGEMLAESFPSVIFIQSEKNIGFAKANNLGARQARGMHLLLLNPDTEFRENSIRIMLDYFPKLPRVGAVGCKLLNTDGTLQTTSVLPFPTILNQVLDSEFLQSKFRNWKLWGISALYADPPRPMEVEVISGACVLIARSLYAKIGGFSEEFFMYSEDVDLGWKIRQAGTASYYLPVTTIVHHGGSSTNQTVNNFSTIMMRHSTALYLKLRRGTFMGLAYRGAMAAVAFARLLLIIPLVFVFFTPRRSASFKKWCTVLWWSLGIITAKTVLIRKNISLCDS